MKDYRVYFKYPMEQMRIFSAKNKAEAKKKAQKNLQKNFGSYGKVTIYEVTEKR